MTTHQTDQRGRGRSPLKLVTAATMSLIVVLLAACSDDTANSTSASFTEIDAERTVEAYYAAAEAGDADAIATLFVDPTGNAFEENLRLEVWNAGQGMIRVDRVCSAGNTTPEGFEVRACEFGDHQYLQRVAGAPATPILQTFTVSESGIEELELAYLRDGYDASDAFNSWMLANHPDDAAAADCCGGDTVDEARANGELRLQYAELWAAHLEETGCTYTDIGC